MNVFANTLIDALGGTSEVARMLVASVSTVHSWRTNGIPPSRLAHLKLATKEAEKAVDWTTGKLLHDPSPSADVPSNRDGDAEPVREDDLDQHRLPLTRAEQLFETGKSGESTAQAVIA